MRHLASMRVIEETAANTYKATLLSEALTIPKYRDAIPFWYAVVTACRVHTQAKSSQFRSSWTYLSEATKFPRQDQL